MSNHEQNYSIKDVYEAFYDALKVGGIPSIVKTAVELYDSPVLLTNEDYHLICQYPQEPIGNTIWDTLLVNKTLPSETIYEYQKKLLNKRKEIYEPFYSNKGIVKESPRIFGEVTHKNRVLGHVAIFLMDKPLRDNDLDIAKIFVDTLAIEIIRRENSYGNAQAKRAIYLKDLLENRVSILAKQHIAEKLTQKIIGNYLIIVTLVGSKASDKAFASYAAVELSGNYKNVVSVIYENAIVTLIGGLSRYRKPEESKLVSKVINFLTKNDMESGTTGLFSDLSVIDIKYKQAYLTAQIIQKEQKQSIGTYDDYAPLQMFYELAQKDPLNVYLHPVIDRMKKYDKENNTEYYETLKAYSLSIHNKESAAQKLGIHRNTLLYRLNRIKDIFELPIENQQTALSIICSYLLSEI